MILKINAMTFLWFTWARAVRHACIYIKYTSKTVHVYDYEQYLRQKLVCLRKQFYFMVIANCHLLPSSLHSTNSDQVCKYNIQKAKTDVWVAKSPTYVKGHQDRYRSHRSTDKRRCLNMYNVICLHTYLCQRSNYHMTFLYESIC